MSRSGAPLPASTPSAMRIRGDGILVLEGESAAARLLLTVRGGDEVAEERVRGERARLVLGVELAGEEPRVGGVLDDLDELLVRRDPRDLHPSGLELREELLVHLVAVTVPVDRDVL